MLAKEVDWVEMLQEHTECAQTLPERSMIFTTNAKEDVYRLKRHLMTASKRKSCPLHSPPAEILLMALCPSWRMDLSSKTSKLGLGAEKLDKLRAPATALAFQKGYYHINQSTHTPLKWHLSWGASIPKNNGKPNAAGQRVVHRLDEQGKAFFSGKMKAAEEKSSMPITHMAQGFVPKRRREAGILCQLSSVWRLKRAKRSGLLLNLDMANAFGSTKWEKLEEVNDTVFLEQDRGFGRQRFECTSVELPCSEKPITVRPGTGALMGDQYAVKSFLGCYEEPTNVWNMTEVFRMPPADAAFFSLLVSSCS